MKRMLTMIGALALAACGGAGPDAPGATEPAAEAQKPAGAASPSGDRDCPMADPGVEIAVAEAEGGIALTFTGDAGRVDELRAMARRMAAMHERRRERGADRGMRGGKRHEGKKMRRGAQGKPGAGPGRGMKMPAADVAVEDLDDGVRVVVTAKDANEVEALRAHVRKRVERMRSGECPMMEPSMKDRSPGEAPAGEPPAEAPVEDHEAHHPG